MLMILKTITCIIIILTIRGIVPRYKVDVLIEVVWKQLLILTLLTMLLILL